MARKTNKTAHVLNLLASGGIKTDQTPSTQETTVNQSKIMFVDSPQNPSNPVAVAIKDSLDQELIKLQQEEADAEILSASNALIEDESLDENEVSSVEPEICISDEPLETDELDEAQNMDEPQNLNEPQNIEEPKDLSPIEEKQSVEVPIENSTVSKPEPLPLEEPSYGYHLLNIMEVAVDDLILEYIEKFNVCSCDRCVQDVKALALSNLPPKYIVAEDSTIKPLTSFYESKYSFEIMTELTKACLQVIDYPRHQPQ